MTRIIHLGVLLTALLLVGAACGGATATTTTVRATTVTAASPAPTTTVAVTTTQAATATTVALTTTTVAAPTTTAAPFEPTEPSVHVNDGWLAYECRGEGSPTVVIDHGLAGGATTVRDPNWGAWGRAMDMIAETNRVCMYGRRGVFGSEPVPSSPFRTTQDQVDDLNGLIDTLELETPVILVGHSQGGFNIRLLAGQNPDKVAGLVFVDGSDPVIDEFGPTPPPSPSEWLDLVTSGTQASAVQDLGDLPVYVLTAIFTDDRDGTVSERPDYWYDVQDSLLALSTNSVQTMVEATHNTIYWAQPESIVEAVVWVTARTG